MRNTLNSFIILTMIVTFNPVRSCNENYIVYKPTALRSVAVDISRELDEVRKSYKLNEQKIYLDDEIFEDIKKAMEGLSKRYPDTYFDVFVIDELVKHHFKVNLSNEQIKDMDIGMKILYFVSKISQRMTDIFSKRKFTKLQEEDFHDIKDDILSVLKKAPNYETPYELPISINYITNIIVNYLESPSSQRLLSENQKGSLKDILSSYLHLYEYVRNIQIREGAHLDKENFENFLAVIEENSQKHITYLDAFEVNDLVYNCLNVELSDEQIENIEHITAESKREYFDSKISQRMTDIFSKRKFTKLQEEDFQVIEDIVLKVLKETPNYATSYELPISVNCITDIINKYLKSSFNINLSQKQKEDLEAVLELYEDSRKKLKAAHNQ